MTEDEKQEAILEKMMLHQVNADAAQVNKGIVQQTSALKEVPIDNQIYQPGPVGAVPQPQIQQPIPQQIPQPIPQQIPQQVQQPPPQIQQIVQQDLTPLIERVTNLEAQVTRFVNLIERNVAKNAKEINIRIKLNENNDSTDKE